MAAVVLTLVVCVRRQAAEEANPDMSEFVSKVRQNFGLQVSLQEGSWGKAMRMIVGFVPWASVCAGSLPCLVMGLRFNKGREGKAGDVLTLLVVWCWLVQAEGGSFQCRRCQGVKTSHHAQQTRSSDEPMTMFIHCETCGHRWKEH